MYSVVGKHNSGLTTLGKLLAGLIAPDSGAVDITEIAKGVHKNSLTRIPQVAWIPKGVISSLSPVANVTSMIWVYAVASCDAEEIALGALKEVGITKEAFTESSKLGAKALRANFAYHLIRRVKLWCLTNTTTGSKPLGALTTRK